MVRRQSGVDLSVSSSTDGFTIAGGITSERELTVKGGDLTLEGGSGNTFDFPPSADTLVGETSTQTLTNKTITGSFSGSFKGDGSDLTGIVADSASYGIDGFVIGKDSGGAETLKVGGQISGSLLKLDRDGTIFISSSNVITSDGNALYLGGVNKTAGSIVFQPWVDHIYPTSNNIVNLGLSGNRWAGVYTNILNASASIILDRQTESAAASIQILSKEDQDASVGYYSGSVVRWITFRAGSSTNDFIIGHYDEAAAWTGSAVTIENLTKYITFSDRIRWGGGAYIDSSDDIFTSVNPDLNRMHVSGSPTQTFNFVGPKLRGLPASDAGDSGSNQSYPEIGGFVAPAMGNITADTPFIYNWNGSGLNHALNQPGVSYTYVSGSGSGAPNAIFRAINDDALELYALNSGGDVILELDGLNIQGGTANTAWFSGIQPHSDGYNFDYQLEIVVGTGDFQVVHTASALKTKSNTKYFVSSGSGGNITKARFTFSNMTNPAYVKSVAIIPRNRPQNWNWLDTGGGNMYGDVNFYTGSLIMNYSSLAGSGRLQFFSAATGENYDQLSAGAIMYNRRRDSSPGQWLWRGLNNYSQMSLNGSGLAWGDSPLVYIPSSSMVLLTDGSRPLTAPWNANNVISGSVFYATSHMNVLGVSGFTSKNPNNQLASVAVNWTSDQPRIRIGGSGAGADATFLIQGASDLTRMSLTNTGNATFPGYVSSSAVTSSFYTEKDLVISGSGIGLRLHGQDNTIIFSNNNDANGHVQADGILYLGDGGTDAITIGRDTGSIDTRIRSLTRIYPFNAVVPAGTEQLIVSGNVRSTNAVTASAGFFAGDTSYNESASVFFSDTMNDPKIRNVLYPKGAYYTTDVPLLSGSIQIDLPKWSQLNTHTMISFVIDIFNYTTDKSMTILVSGYTYNVSETWINTTVRILGTDSMPTNRVVLATQDSGTVDARPVVLIGDNQTQWNYPKAVVSRFMGGFSSGDNRNWETGWSGSLVQDSSSYTDFIVWDPSNLRPYLVADPISGLGIVSSSTQITQVDSASWADKLDNLDGSEYAVLAENETVTGAWGFSGPAALTSGTITGPLHVTGQNSWLSAIPNDIFSFNSKLVPHYGLKWDIDPTNINLAAWLTGYGGIRFFTQGTNRWLISGSTGHFVPTSDDTYDIGTSTSRVRQIYGTASYADVATSAATASYGTNPFTVGSQIVVQTANPIIDYKSTFSTPSTVRTNLNAIASYLIDTNQNDENNENRWRVAVGDNADGFSSGFLIRYAPHNTGSFTNYMHIFGGTGATIFSGSYVSASVFRGDGEFVTGVVSSSYAVSASWAANGGGAPASSFTWNVITAHQTGSTDNGYQVSGSSQIKLFLPATATIGDTMSVMGIMAGGWRIAQGASQQIHFGNQSSTAGVAGYIESTDQRDATSIVCVAANNEWQVQSSVGNITIN